MYNASCLVLCNDTHLATTRSRMTHSHQVTIEAIQGLEPVGIVALMIDTYTSCETSLWICGHQLKVSKILIRQGIIRVKATQGSPYHFKRCHGINRKLLHFHIGTMGTLPLSNAVRRLGEESAGCNID